MADAGTPQNGNGSASFPWEEVASAVEKLLIGMVTGVVVPWFIAWVKKKVPGVDASSSSQNPPT